jgi:hypothetical protein
LREAFDRVEGPQRLEYTEYGADKKVYLWQTAGSRLDPEALLRHLDFLRLVEAAR